MQVAEASLDARAIAARIRQKVADIKDELLLAELAELDVEFNVVRNRENNRTVDLRVWISQEVR